MQQDFALPWIACSGPGHDPVNSTELPADQIYEILLRFDEAQSLLSVCHRSLTLNDAPNGPFDEAALLADAIKKFRSVRNEFDEFAVALSPSRKR